MNQDNNHNNEITKSHIEKLLSGDTILSPGLCKFIDALVAEIVQEDIKKLLTKEDQNEE